MVYAVGLCAALCLGLGFVLQQHVAQRAPEADVLRARLLLDLVREPLWVLGIGAMVVGQLLGAVALRQADITVVEPLLTANLLFALLLALLLYRQPVGLREIAGIASLGLGMATFLVAAGPHGGDPDGALVRWIFAAALAGVAVVAAATAFARVGGPAARAMMFGASAGLLFGVQDALTRSALVPHGGPAPLVLTWQPYAVIGVAVVGLVIAQSAFKTAPLATSLPAITMAEPLAGIAVGVVVFGEHVRLAPLPLAFEAAGLAAMVAGVLLVAGSKVLVERRHHGVPHPRRELVKRSGQEPPC